MRFKKTLLSLIAIMLCVIFAAEPVLAAGNTYGVGEEVHLTFGSQTQMQGGTTNVTTQKQQSIIDANQAIDKLALEKIIPLLTKDPDSGEDKLPPVYAMGKDSYVYVYEDTIPRTYIDTIASKVSIYIPGDPEIIDNAWEDDDPIWNPLNSDISYDPMSFLEEHVVAKEHGSVTEKTKGDIISELKENDGTWADISLLRDKLQYEYGGNFVRVKIPGVPELIDFETKEDRYNALTSYLGNEIGTNSERNLTSDFDVTVQYIVQYQVYDAAESIIRSRTPLNNYYTFGEKQFSHYFQIENTESLALTDSIFANKNENGKVDFRYTFVSPGTYNIHAHQWIREEYWDMMTFNKCEYLVIAETGQIIWKNESKGGALNPEWPSWVNRLDVRKNHTQNTEKIETQQIVVRAEDIGEDLTLSVLSGSYHTIRIE